MRSGDYLVSIIIPIYNICSIERHFIQCINSLINQTYHNLEILLVNDGSSDKSADILTRESQRDQRIKVLSKPNGGVESARRYGIHASSGDYLFHIDQDDVLDKKTIELLVGTAINHDADVVCGDFLQFVHSLQFVRRSVEKFSEHEIVTNQEEFITRLYGSFFGSHGFPIQIWNKLYKRSFIESLPEPECCGEYCEDLYYNIQVLPCAKTTVYLPSVTYYYRWGGYTSKRINRLMDTGILVYHIRKRQIQQYNLKEYYENTCIDLLNFMYTTLYQGVSIDKATEEQTISTYSNIMKTNEVQEAVLLLKGKVYNQEYLNYIINKRPKDLYAFIVHSYHKNAPKRVLQRIIASL